MRNVNSLVQDSNSISYDDIYYTTHTPLVCVYVCAIENQLWPEAKFMDHASSQKLKMAPWH